MATQILAPAQPESAAFSEPARFYRYRPTFPAPELCQVAAAAVWDSSYEARSLQRRPIAGQAPEGPACFVTISPGAVRLRRLDLAKAQRASEKAVEHRRRSVAALAGWRASEAVRHALGLFAEAGLIDQDQVPDQLPDPGKRHPGRQRITEWSAKSRANMTYRLLTLDYAPMLQPGRLPAMVTFTLPDYWWLIAPTGAAFKRLIRLFQRRYAREYGAEFLGVWKLEFQRRGAPHMHVLTAPPVEHGQSGQTWRRWFASTWSSIVATAAEKSGAVCWLPGALDQLRADVFAVHQHPKACADYAEALRFSDPRRVAVYFTKHNLLANKEYQHRVPIEWAEEGAGPGRFWGVWGLEVVEHSAEITRRQADQIARMLRGLERAAGGVRKARVPRVNTRTGVVSYRTVVRRIRRVRATFGFLAVNDGATVGFVVGRLLETRDGGGYAGWIRTQPPPPGQT